MTDVNNTPPAKPDYDVLIVGAGVAGLYAAYLLGRSNISCAVLEADDRPGGRVYSRPEASTELGLTLDEGANLINSTDILALRLMNNASISYVRRISPRAESINYFVGGFSYSQAEADALLFGECPSAMTQFAADQQIWREDPDRDINPLFTDNNIANSSVRFNS
jgi:monoamine oxidase